MQYFLKTAVYILLHLYCAPMFQAASLCFSAEEVVEYLIRWPEVLQPMISSIKILALKTSTSPESDFDLIY